MLTLTDQASSIVTAIVTDQFEAAEAGLRIHQADAPENNSETAFALQVVPEPESSDVVITGGGSPVYLDEPISSALTDKILDASVNEDGAVRFQLLQQD